MPHLDLTDAEAEALAQELAGIIDSARYPLSSRIQTLRAVLTRLSRSAHGRQLRQSRGSMRRRREAHTESARVRAVDRSREFDDIGNEYRSSTRLELEKGVLIDALGMGIDHGRGPATTKAEIVWRDREYAEEQENSRRGLEREMPAAALLRLIVWR